MPNKNDRSKPPRLSDLVGRSGRMSPAEVSLARQWVQDDWESADVPRALVSLVGRLLDTLPPTESLQSSSEAASRVSQIVERHLQTAPLPWLIMDGPGSDVRPPFVETRAVTIQRGPRIKILLGKRQGEWSLPGGRLENMETAEGAIRQQLREAGVEAESVSFGFCANVRRPVHHVRLVFVAIWKSGGPRGHQWFDMASPPSPLSKFSNLALDNVLGLRPFQEI